MILAALAAYYERLAAAPDSDVAPYGWSRQKIGFVVVLDPDGSLHAIEPPPTVDEAAGRKFESIVPGQSKPSGAGIKPCFLWDNAAYLLGVVPEGRDAEWAWGRFEGFRAAHMEREREVDEPAYSAVCAFLRSWSQERLARHTKDMTRATGFGVFRVRPLLAYVHQAPSVVRYWNARVKSGDVSPTDVQSLIDGAAHPLARLHEPKIKGVRGAQTSGALLSSCNLDAAESFGREQGSIAPIGSRQAFEYCTALNKLLADGRRRVHVGDATTVFWTESPHPIEDITGHLLGGTEDEDTARRVEAFLRALREGRQEDAFRGAQTRFYVLGLAPNAARLSVRLWLEGTVGEFAHHLARHAAALEMAGAPVGYRFPSLRRLVAETAPPRNGWADEERISPVLAGEVARVVLGGLPYPRSLLIRVLQRVRAEGFADPEKRTDHRAASHRRASILKACLVEGGLDPNKEIQVSLNEDHPAVAYQLGRLFAVLEKTQEEAFDGAPNASIRDRFLGSASGTPLPVFPRLLRLHAHHLRKLENAGRRVNLERLVGSICSQIDSAAGFPSHLPIEGQALFFLGYYQQRQALFTSKKAADAVTADA